VYESLFTLRRTQGAIGRYEGTTGAAVTAAGRLDGLDGGRCRRRRISGEQGKGLRYLRAESGNACSARDCHRHGNFC